MIAALVIPLVGYWYTHLEHQKDLSQADIEKDKETQSKYVELALAILREPPTLEKQGLRKWAVTIVSSYSKVPLDEETKSSLVNDVPLTASTASGVLQITFVQGVDMSSWETTPLSQLSNSPVKFVLLRCTQGLNKKDSVYKARRETAKSAGFISGAYHSFSFEQDASQQAKLYLESAELRTGDFPPVLDVEELPGRPLPPAENCRTMLLAWLQAVETATKSTPVIYVNRDLANEILDTRFGRYRLWIAQYSDSQKPTLPKMWNDWFLWQYSGQGSIPGVTTQERFDLDRFNGSLESLKQNLIN